MGYLLTQLGYKKVTILEKSNRVGGKSKTINIDGIPYGSFYSLNELISRHGNQIFIRTLQRNNKATWRIQNWKSNQTWKNSRYFHIKSFFNEYLLKKDWLSVYFPEKPDVAVDKKEWLLRTVETATDSCTCCCNTVQIVNLISAISRYDKIRKSMFGENPYYFLPKPNKEVMEMMNMTFHQFLEKHDLLALQPIIDIGVTAQGKRKFSNLWSFLIGYPPHVPAYYGLMFVTTDVLKDALKRDDSMQ
jgi:hypothetical protein